MSNIGQRIKDKRLEKGLTQEELGNILGVKKSAIQKYENGTIVNLKADTIQKLCNLFNCLPYEFLWEDLSDIEERSIAFLRAHENIRNQLLEFELGSLGAQLAIIFGSLNQQGKNKVIEYAEDLSKISEYR